MSNFAQSLSAVILFVGLAATNTVQAQIFKFLQPGSAYRIGAGYDPFNTELSAIGTVQLAEKNLKVSQGKSLEVDVKAVTSFEDYCRRSGVCASSKMRFLFGDVRAEFERHVKEQSENKEMSFDIFASLERREEFQGDTEEIISKQLAKDLSVIEEHPSQFFNRHGRYIITGRRVEVGLLLRVNFRFSSQHSKNDFVAKFAVNANSGSASAALTKTVEQFSSHVTFNAHLETWGVEPGGELARLCKALEENAGEQEQGKTKIAEIVKLMSQLTTDVDWTEGRVVEITAKPITGLLSLDVLAKLQLVDMPLRIAMAEQVSSEIQRLLESKIELDKLRMLALNPSMQDYFRIGATSQIHSAKESIIKDLKAAIDRSQQLGSDGSIVPFEPVVTTSMLDWNEYVDADKIKSRIRITEWGPTYFLCLYPSWANLSHGCCNLRLEFGPQLQFPPELYPFIDEVTLFSDANGMLDISTAEKMEDRRANKRFQVCRAVQKNNYDCKNGHDATGKTGEDNVRSGIAVSFAKETLTMEPKVLFRLKHGLPSILIPFEQSPIFKNEQIAETESAVGE